MSCVRLDAKTIGRSCHPNVGTIRLYSSVLKLINVCYSIQQCFTGIETLQVHKNRENKEPEVILFYNKNKVDVDAMDQMIRA